MLGPDSLTWKYLGDRRLLFFLHRTGTLQNMHPAVAAVLLEHSDFFDDPYDRFARSIPHILGVVYDPPADATGERVRDFHKGLKATDHIGRRWHALDPAVFYWTHATFVEMIVAMTDAFGRPLTPAEKDRLIAESVVWWRRYGMTDRVVEAHDWASFDAYWNRMLATELERNAVTDFAFAPGQRHPAPPGAPEHLWKLLSGPVDSSSRWMSNALLPARARAILGLEWSRADQAVFDAFRGTVRRTWPLVPPALRYAPRAQAGMRRASASASQPAAVAPAR